MERDSCGADRDRRRILYLALADARGHLMRAHLVAELLAPAGIELDLVTTSREGQAFLAGLGRDSRLLSEELRVEFGPRHDLLRRETAARALSYLTRPSGALRDLLTLSRWARSAALVVNDSQHPALLLAPLLGSRMRVVQLYGANLRKILEEEVAAQGWRGRAEARLLASAFSRSHAEIVHSLEGGTDADPSARRWQLPTLVPPQPRTRDEARRRLGLGANDRLVAAYLNPHYRDDRIAAAVEAACARRATLLGVSEPFAGRPGWRAQDAGFSNVVLAADAFVSGAGRGALELARTTGTPLLALLGDQPEQTRNAAEVGERLLLRALPLAQVLATPSLLTASLAQVLASGMRSPPVPVESIRRQWRAVFEALVQPAAKESHHGYTANPQLDGPVGPRRPRAGDEQPALG